jgi:hypothetical protein
MATFFREQNSRFERERSTIMCEPNSKPPGEAGKEPIEDLVEFIETNRAVKTVQLRHDKLFALAAGLFVDSEDWL